MSFCWVFCFSMSIIQPVFHIHTCCSHWCRVLSSGLWHCVVWLKVTVSGGLAATILRVGPFNISTLKVKSVPSSRTLVTLYRTALRLIAEGSNLFRQCCNNPIFYIKILVFPADSNWLLVYEMSLECGSEGTDHVSRDALAFHLPLSMCSLSLPSLGITFFV
jgi:hypothetical protein